MNLESEVICGHLVTAEQKKVNAVFLDLLQEFGRLCEKANITWWVGFGALIGAVRHKGFIPWDDDVDILVPREDFDRLRRMTQEDFGVQEPYFLANPVTEPTRARILMRFRRGDTTGMLPSDFTALREWRNKPRWNLGIGLSIFPLDNYPSTSFEQFLREKIGYIFVGIHNHSHHTKTENTLVHYLCRGAEAVLGPNNLMTLTHHTLRRKSRSGKVQAMASYYPNCFIWPEEIFAETVYLPFEDITIPVPAGYDQLLRISYGDYMQFPPPEKRVGKHDAFVDADTPYTVHVQRVLDELENK